MAGSNKLQKEKIRYRNKGKSFLLQDLFNKMMIPLREIELVVDEFVRVDPIAEMWIQGSRGKTIKYYIRISQLIPLTQCGTEHSLERIHDLQVEETNLLIGWRMR
ncbi:uncharacterized protein LOC107774039 isoform X2 [Nicotiana tabacum]|uniref:Uncharacterized protein LOC107774039 isoform X2 n=1 Tax=Nicotiana tabacum TaxID=4097 RepID=A0AC58TUU8_TOBAC